METAANVYEGLVGPFNVVMLAHDTDDFTAIRAEVDKVTKQLNTNTSEYAVSFFNGPMTNLDLLVTNNSGLLMKFPIAIGFCNKAVSCFPIAASGAQYDWHYTG